MPSKISDSVITPEIERSLFKAIVPRKHAYRKLNRVINFSKLTKPLKSLYSPLGQHGIPIRKGFKALLIQFWEDLSDREMENAVRENLAIRWFCEFRLAEKTPDYSYFCKLRKRIKPNKIAEIFNTINRDLHSKGLFGNVFTFVDASSIVAKTSLWEERDRAIADGKEKLNNAVVSKYSADKEARWGAKSKSKIWFGYKRHTAVDMKFGLITKTTVTPADIPDFRVLRHICPEDSMVFLDKLFDVASADKILKQNRCHPATIRKKNNPVKNCDLDRWRSQVRMPFESIFSKLPKRTRYRGLLKVMFQNYLESITYNLKIAISALQIAT